MVPSKGKGRMGQNGRQTFQCLPCTVLLFEPCKYITFNFLKNAFSKPLRQMLHELQLQL